MAIMIGANLRLLRNRNQYTLEQVAEILRRSVGVAHERQFFGNERMVKDMNFSHC